MASAGTFDIRKWTTFLRGEREGGDRFNDSHPRLMPRVVADFDDRVPRSENTVPSCNSCQDS